MPTIARTRFRREALPPARTVFETSGVIKLGARSDRKGNVRGDCLAHQSKSRTSCSYNVNSGLFFCHSCGVKGDLIGFVRLRDQCDFRTACQHLGVWDETGSYQPPARVLVNFLVCDFVIDGKQYRAEIRDEPTSELQRLRRYQAEASDRLLELRRGDPERCADETEVQWSILSSTWHLIQMESA